MSKSESEYNLERVKKGIRIGSEMLADLMQKSNERDDALIAQLIPLLSDGAKREIVAGKHIYYKSTEITDEELLKEYLSMLILDFDCNIHRLEENEISAFAEVINKNPSVLFFFDDD